MHRFYIDNIGISRVNLQATVDFLKDAVSNRLTGYVCVNNSRTTYISNRDAAYCNIQNNSLLTVPDGMPLVWIAHSRGFDDVSKVSGKDLMDAIFSISVAKGYTHYFYGCSTQTLQLLKQKLQLDYPGIHIAATVSPPFQPIQDFNIEELASEVNKMKPTFFWCGLGAPKQERLMALLQPHLKHTISIGVGLAFEYFAGTVTRAPQWIRENGFEWTYRLMQQPNRIRGAVKPLTWILVKYFKAKLSA
jgi:N-acetylglucosaminyldiphosphoundecaprenol N-acetyl-beta-D-mannosaminyltransferase